VTNNWWGSSDTTKIEGVIVDGTDPVLTTKQIGIIHYKPFANTRIVEAGFSYPLLLTGLKE